MPGLFHERRAEVIHHPLLVKSFVFGLEIKQHSPFGHTMILELANGSVGYLPNRRAFEEGGYEPEASLFCPGVGEQIVNMALTLLNRLHNSQPLDK